MKPVNCNGMTHVNCLTQFLEGSNSYINVDSYYSYHYMLILDSHLLILLMVSPTEQKLEFFVEPNGKILF